MRIFRTVAQLGGAQPTPRSYAGLLGVALLAGLSSLWSPLLIFAGVWAGLLCMLLLMDWRISPQPDDWTLTRAHDNRLSLDAANPIRIRILRRAGSTPMRLWGSAQVARIWVRDTPPPIFRVSNPTHILTGELPPGGEITLSYTVHPPRRGNYTFGHLYLRWQTALGLLRRQMTVPAQAPVRVYPNLSNVRRYDILVRRNRTWELGLRRSQRFGAGSEFERLRDYQPDDEYRRINWKATARKAIVRPTPAPGSSAPILAPRPSTPVVMEYETERSQTIIALLDIGRMMRSPVGDIAKLDYAINAVLLLAYVAVQKGDRVGLLTFADAPQVWVSPGGGKAHFHRLLEQLYAVESVPIEPDYGAAMSFFAAKQKKRSLVLVFSDLTGDLGAKSLFAHMAQLQKRHLSLLVTLRDPTVQHWARQRPQDSEELYRRTVAEQVLDERRLLLERLQRHGVSSLDAPASELSAAVINRYLELKARAML